MKLKSILGLMLIPTALGLTTTALAEGTLNVTNWAEYIGADTIRQFRKRVQYQGHL